MFWLTFTYRHDADRLGNRCYRRVCGLLRYVTIISLGGTFRPLIGGTLSRPHDRFPNVFRGRFWQKYPYFLPSLVSACYSGFAFLLALFVFKEVSVQITSLLPI
jgi:hypothetical protein